MYSFSQEDLKNNSFIHEGHELELHLEESVKKLILYYNFVHQHRFCDILI